MNEWNDIAVLTPPGDIDIASVPEHIRGYGHVKERFHADAMKRQDDLLHAWRNPSAARSAA